VLFRGCEAVRERRKKRCRSGSLRRGSHPCWVNPRPTLRHWDTFRNPYDPEVHLSKEVYSEAQVRDLALRNPCLLAWQN
jgi:hypothetical protein